jgi:hypothetical protein
MRIACIGWGSLIYEPGELKIYKTSNPEDSWCSEGPLLPIEFARHSSGNRITLVLVPGAQTVKTLWNLFTVDALPDARESLREREKIPHHHADDWISDWDVRRQPSNSLEETVSEWARRLNLESAVWTNLPPKWADEVGRIPSQNEVLKCSVALLQTAAYVRSDTSGWLRGK